MKNKQWLSSALALTLGLSLTAGCNRGGGQEEGEKAGNKPGNAAVQPAANREIVVQVTPASQETVQEIVPVTGSLASTETVTLTPKVSGRIVQVNGREGTAVRRGEVIVQQETDDYQRQLQQAQANLASAQAQYAAQQANLQSAQARVTQAETNLGLQQASSQSAVQDAQQQVKAAQANLELARRPQRNEEVAVAENNVRQAQANYEKAQTDRQRYESLVKEGAAAQATLDQYVTTEKVAKANLDSARQQLEIAQEGGRAEQIRNAETVLARAQTALRLAQANRGQIQVRENDIQAARAAVAQARAAVAQAQASIAQNRAAVALAQQQVENAAVRSPIDGVISERTVEPGQVVAPGAQLVTLVSLDTVYFEAQIPGVDVARVQRGQNVRISLDAYPGRTFTGTVTRIYPAGNTASRIFNARVELNNANGLLRPGLFARGEVVAERKPNAVTIPVEALLTESIGSLDAQEAEAAARNVRVFVVENNVARERKVEVGLDSRDGKRVEVSNVQAGEPVVVVGQRGLKDGDRVTIQQNNSTATQTAEG